jgi:hypothetical protein
VHNVMLHIDAGDCWRSSLQRGCFRSRAKGSGGEHPEKGSLVKMRRIIYMLGSVAIALTIMGSGTAFAASHPSAQTKAQWHEEISNLRTPGSGCYHASYPALQWHATPCLVAPNVPLVPRMQTRGGPLTIGNGSDYAAQVTGKISQATGTFTNVSSNLTEKGQIGGVGPQVKNAFTLQLNSEFFSTPVCSGSGTPSECLGWQQFIYAYHYSGNTNVVFMQYWLLNWDTTCPAGWNTFNTGSNTDDCYENSAATSYGALPAKDLGDISLVAKASSGGTDTVTLSSSLGGASSASGNDSKLDLAGAWNATEWGAFGDAGGAEANFGADSTLEAQTAFQATSSSAPTCLATGFTGETNNLNLTKTSALGSEPSPTMSSKQTNGTAKKKSCAVAS